MHHHDAGCFMHTFLPFRSVQWYACHACLCHPLAFYASLQYLFTWSCMSLACQCVVHASTQWSYRNSIQTYIGPSWTPPFVCIFACLLICLFAFLLVCLSWGLPCLLPYAMLAMSILLVCFEPFAHYLRISFFPLFVYWFLVFAFACTHMEQGRMELGHGLPSASQKG